MSARLMFSRKISSFSYDPGNARLKIVFASGTSQEYCEVPEHVCKALSSARDPDSYFDEDIYGMYPLYDG